MEKYKEEHYNKDFGRRDPESIDNTESCLSSFSQCEAFFGIVEKSQEET